VVEADPGGELDDREVAAVRLGEHLRRYRIQVPVQLDGQRRQAPHIQLRHEIDQRPGVLAQRVPGGEQQLVRLHPGQDVGYLHDVQALDDPVQPARPGQHLGASQCGRSEHLPYPQPDRRLGGQRRRTARRLGNFFHLDTIVGPPTVEGVQRHVEIRTGVYRDSVQLMQVSQAVRDRPGVSAALVAMATGLNLELAAGLGFAAPPGARPEDLLVAIAAGDGAALAGALSAVDAALAPGVRPGPVGLVAASGTGAQQVMCLLDAAGVGISHCLGVGGRDLSAAVAGRSTLAALDVLDADPATELIVVVSKPPAPEVAARVEKHAAELRTPVVFALPGRGRPDLAAAVEQVAPATWPTWRPERPATSRHGSLRGLFAGGTLRDEAALIV